MPGGEDLDQIKQFVAGTESVTFKSSNREEAYQRVAGCLAGCKRGVKADKNFKKTHRV
jgi:hypothetical protein